MANQSCQAEACAIQTCLTQNNYNQSKCDKAVEALYRCCDQMYREMDKSGKQEKSTACPVREVVYRRLKQFEREKGKGE